MDLRQGRPDLVTEAAASPGSRSKTATTYRLRRAGRDDRHVSERPVHVGPEQRPAGRAGEPPSRDLAESLKALRLHVGPAEDRHAAAPPSPQHRLLAVRGAARRRSAGAVLVHDRRDRAAADRLPSRSTRPIGFTTSCASTSAQSPLFNGQISGIGPRYCPSLEDKVMRFPDRERHQLFLEPEGLDVDEIYVNGFSMSLPAEFRNRLVHALPGLEDAVMMRPGYAVEYDFIQPTELDRRWRRSASRDCSSPVRSTARPATRKRRRRVWWPGSTPPAERRARSPFVLGRDEAYIGVLVDDLTTKGASSPTGCSRRGRSTGCCCGSTTRTCG